MPTVHYSTRNRIKSSVICDGSSSKAVLYSIAMLARVRRRLDVKSLQPAKDRSNLLSVVRAVCFRSI